jgi:hypothetical protein
LQKASVVTRDFSVNLGGLFVLEPFITPSFYQKYAGANDEWTLHTMMAADTASGGFNQLEDHYKTFIVSEAILLGSSLSLIGFGRLPLGRRRETSRRLRAQA